MGLFKPKAPKVPEGVAFQFHFPNDNRRDDGSYRPMPADLQIDAAVERVALELVKLRGRVCEGASLPSSEALQRDADRAYAANAAASKDRELKCRQFAGGTATQADVAKADLESDNCRRRFRLISDDLRKRKQADQAQAELSRILKTLQ